MTITLLLDLDDTLLVNDINTFLPVYLKELSGALVPYAEPEKMVNALYAATRKMARNDLPDCTLRDVFNNAFYPVLGLVAGDLQPVLEQFYGEVFPKLQYLTQPRPEAIQLVESALERGYRLAVTTNPLFPRQAILHRLSWAGLPADRVPFELVTSYETFHFAKPSPAFYAEVLAYLGWPEGPVVVVGDSLENDIQAAHQLGVSAFWLPASPDAPCPESSRPTGSGGLQDLLAWLDRCDPAELLPDYTTPSACLAVMRATPAMLHTFTQQVPPEHWADRKRPDEWSLTEILCHLRDVDHDVNLPRLLKVLNEDNPFLPGMDTDPWATERNYRSQDGQVALHRFMAGRTRLVEQLSSISPDDWQRTARHAILGTTSLAELVNIIAAHDRLHVQQTLQAV